MPHLAGTAGARCSSMRRSTGRGCTRAAPTRETGAGRVTALELAESLGDTDYQLRALWGLWASRMINGEFRPALDLARRFHELSARSADPADSPIGDRMLAVSLHFLGDQGGARAAHRAHARPLRRVREPVRTSSASISTRA